MSNIFELPTKLVGVKAAAVGLSEAIKAGRVRAVAIVSIEVGDNGEQIARIRNGWGEQNLTVFEVLAFSAAVDHTKNEILGTLET